MHKKALYLFLIFYLNSFAQKAIELNNIGLQKYNQKDYKGAILFYSKAIKENSKFAIAYNNRGLAYYRLEEYQKSINDYDIALKLNPKFIEVYSNRGNAKDALNYFTEAINDYNKYLEFKPNDAGIYNDRGYAKNELNQYQNAISDFNKAIQLNPKYAIAYYNRGVSNYKLGKEENGCNDLNIAYSLGFSKAKSTIEKFCNDSIKNKKDNIISKPKKGISNNIIEDKNSRAIQVVGYLTGLEKSFEIISEYYPEFNYDISRLRLLYETNYGLSKGNAINFLNKNNLWEVNSSVIEDTFEKIKSNIIISSREDISKKIIEIERKLKGDIESPIFEYILSFQFQDQPHKEFSKDFTYQFSTKGHVKSKNSELILSIPKSWYPKEGKQPNIIKNFVSDCGNGNNIVNILTVEMPFTKFDIDELSFEEIDKVYEKEIFTKEYATEILFSGEYISFKPMKIANRSGFLIVKEEINEKMGVNIKVRTYTFVVHDITYLHLISCAIIASDFEENLEEKSKLLYPLFFMIVNSVVIPKKQENIINLSGNATQKFVDVIISDNSYNFILDTGASISLISKNIINKLLENGIITKQNYLGKDFVETADGKKHLVEFWNLPNIIIGGKKIIDVDFTVMENEIQPLLGMNILNKMNIYKIDLEDNKIYLKN